MASTVQDVYRTSDTALAAYLIIEGFAAPLIEFEDGNRAFFVFSRTEKLDNKVSDYDTARAKGNIVLFFNAYQSLLRRIKERH